jgi:hypothetical protein
MVRDISLWVNSRSYWSWFCEIQCHQGLVTSSLRENVCSILTEWLMLGYMIKGSCYKSTSTDICSPRMNFSFLLHEILQNTWCTTRLHTRMVVSILLRMQIVFQLLIHRKRKVSAFLAMTDYRGRILCLDSTRV